MAARKTPTVETLAHTIEVGMEHDEEVHPSHRKAMDLWMSGLGAIEHLDWMMSHHCWFVIAQAEREDAALADWLQAFWRRASALEPGGAWQGRFMWMARYVVEQRPLFAQALFELTQPWSNAPMEADWYEGNMCEYGQMVSEDRSEHRTFLEFVLREGRVEEALPVLVDAGWTVGEGTPAAYALRHGSLDALEALIEHHGMRGLPLGFDDRDVEGVLQQVKAGRYRLRGYHDETEHAVEFFSDLLSGPLRAVRERRELSEGLGNAPGEQPTNTRRARGPLI